MAIYVCNKCSRITGDIPMFCHHHNCPLIMDSSSDKSKSLAEIARFLVIVAIVIIFLLYINLK